MNSGPVVIGVAGGSGSGKTTVVRRIVESLGNDQVTVLEHDRYYRDRSDLRFEERAALNYDHPDSLDTDLLVRHVQALRAGQPVEVPVYDFTRYNRTGATQTAQPRRAIIVEGILIYTDAQLRAPARHQDLRRRRRRHPVHPPAAPGRRGAGTDDGVGDRAVPEHREADAPGVSSSRASGTRTSSCLRGATIRSRSTCC